VDETGDHHVKQSKLGSKGQRLHVFPHMWKLDLKDKCTHKYICDIYYIYLERENKIVLVSLPGGTVEVGRGNENVRV
jgi:hypothetical protein